MVLGDYFSRELEFLTSASEAAEMTIEETTKEKGLQDVYRRIMALTHIQASLLEITTGLPSGTEDFSLRSVLSEELDLISNYAQLAGTVSVFGDSPLELAQRIISEGVQEGLDAALGHQKLEAFRRGLVAGKGQPQFSLWATLRKIVGLSGRK
jgi:hypothetical protein